MTAFIEKIALFLAWLAGLLGVAMMFHISLDVASKYLFNRPLDGTVEIVSVYYMVGIVFLPIAYITVTGSHIVVELFTAKLSKMNLAKVRVFAALFTFAYVAVFALATFQEAIGRTIQREIWETANANIAAWPSRWILPVSGILMVLAVIIRIRENIRIAASGNNEK